MRKSELRQIIREEISKINEASVDASFKKAKKALSDLKAYFKKLEADIGDGDLTKKQYIASEKEYQKAVKAIEPFLKSDSDAVSAHGTAAQKLYSDAKATLAAVNWMLYGE